MSKIRYTLVALLATLTLAATAQTAAETPFEYPVAPDTCTTLESRCNYITARFWDNYDLSKPIPDDAAFVQAFRDYVDIFRNAHRNVVKSSIRDLMFKAQAVTTNMQKIGRVAEYVFYGANAEFPSDEAYVEFATALMQASQLSKDEREYYKSQVMRINATQPGSPVDLDFVDTAGNKTKLSNVKAPLTIVFFVDENVNSSMGRTHLSVDLILNKAIEEGQLKVVQLYINKPTGEWTTSAPANWTTGYLDKGYGILDLRFIPCCFILDENGLLIEKNISVAELKQSLQ